MKRHVVLKSYRNSEGTLPKKLRKDLRYQNLQKMHQNHVLSLENIQTPDDRDVKPIKITFSNNGGFKTNQNSLNSKNQFESDMFGDIDQDLKTKNDFKDRDNGYCDRKKLLLDDHNQIKMMMDKIIVDIMNKSKLNEEALNDIFRELKKDFGIQGSQASKVTEEIFGIGCETDGKMNFSPLQGDGPLKPIMKNIFSDEEKKIKNLWMLTSLFYVICCILVFQVKLDGPGLDFDQKSNIVGKFHVFMQIMWKKYQKYVSANYSLMENSFQFEFPASVDKDESKFAGVLDLCKKVLFAFQNVFSAAKCVIGEEAPKQVDSDEIMNDSEDGSADEGYDDNCPGQEKSLEENKEELQTLKAKLNKEMQVESSLDSDVSMDESMDLDRCRSDSGYSTDNSDDEVIESNYDQSLQNDESIEVKEESLEVKQENPQDDSKTQTIIERQLLMERLNSFLHLTGYENSMCALHAQQSKSFIMGMVEKTSIQKVMLAYSHSFSCYEKNCHPMCKLFKGMTRHVATNHPNGCAVKHLSGRLLNIHLDLCTLQNCGIKTCKQMKEKKLNSSK